jgi:subtilisin family serine protease
MSRVDLSGITLPRVSGGFVFGFLSIRRRRNRPARAPVPERAVAEVFEERILLAAAVDYGDYFWANDQQIPLLRLVDDSLPGAAPKATTQFTGPQSDWRQALRGIDPTATSFVIEGAQTQLELTGEVYVSVEVANPDVVFSTARGFSSYERVAGTANHYVVTVSAGAAASLAAANALNGLAGIAFAHPNFLVHGVTTSSDPLFSSQWSLQNSGQSGGTIGADVNALGAWEITSGSQDIVVAVLDVGFQTDHPDLAANIFTNRGEIPGNGIDDDGNGWIDDDRGLDVSIDDGATPRIEYDGDPSPAGSYDNHGTAVAGVIAAVADNGRGIAGIAPGVQILPIKIGTADASGAFSTTVSALVSAVYYAAGRTADGAGTWRGADIANHSYNISVPLTALTQAFDWAATHGRNGLGQANFVSAGNSGAGTLSYPASLPSTIAVGATDHNDLRTSYSQYGTGLDFVAPGGGGSSGGWIWTTDRTGSDGYAFGEYVGITGTSFASPLAAGIAALMLSVDPELTAAEIRELMRDSADRDKVAGVSFNSAGWNSQYGYGWLNAASAVQAVADRAGEATATDGNDGTQQQTPLDDIIGRQDSTGQWWVAVSDGDSFSSTSWGAWSTGTHWVDFVTGDFDGDGRKDISARDAATGNIWVGLSTGSGLNTSIWGRWSTTVSLSQTVAGDFNGDGRDDLAVRVENTGDGRWYVAQSTGSSFATGVWGGWTTLKTWGQVQTGDFDGDGLTDIAGRIQNSGDGRWVVMRSTGSRFAGTIWGTWSTYVPWDIFTGDVDGDGRTDLIARTGNAGDGRWFISRSTGTSLQNGAWGSVGSHLALASALVGDFDGDGRADIAVRSASDGYWSVVRSTGTSGQTETWGYWSTLAWTNLVVGDFDGDGRDDIAGRDRTTGVWQVARSMGEHFISSIWGLGSNGTWSFAAAGDVG